MKRINKNKSTFKHTITVKLEDKGKDYKSNQKERKNSL